MRSASGLAVVHIIVCIISNSFLYDARVVSIVLKCRLFSKPVVVCAASALVYADQHQFNRMFGWNWPALWAERTRLTWAYDVAMLRESICHIANIS